MLSQSIISQGLKLVLVSLFEVVNVVCKVVLSVYAFVLKVPDHSKKAERLLICLIALLLKTRDISSCLLQLLLQLALLLESGSRR